MYSPLEQFDILFIDHFATDYFSFDFLNLIFINTVFFFFFVFLSYYKSSFLLVPGKIQLIFEIIYKFFLHLVVQQAGYMAKKYFPFILFVFFIILLFNLFGMLPLGFTITAHISVTFFLSFSVNLGLIFLGFYLNGFNFLKLFVPKGAPKLLLPLIVVIELVSYLIRTFSLSIRLFANMMAGHCLLYVISSFLYAAINFSFLLALVFFTIIYSFVFILEFSIAFSQAYVFSVLLAIYLNDSLAPGH